MAEQKETPEVQIDDERKQNCGVRMIVDLEELLKPVLEVIEVTDPVREASDVTDPVIEVIEVTDPV